MAVYWDGIMMVAGMVFSDGRWWSWSLRAVLAFVGMVRYSHADRVLVSYVSGYVEREDPLLSCVLMRNTGLGERPRRAIRCSLQSTDFPTLQNHPIYILIS